MPIGNIRYSANQFGMGSFVGLNDQIGFWAQNNSGQYLAHGDVVAFDVLTALDTHSSQIEGAATGTQASQTLTVDTVTGWATAGNLNVMGTPVGITVVAGAFPTGSNVPIFGTYTGVGAPSFTGTTMYAATATNGLADEANLSVPPVPITARAADSSAANTSSGTVGLPTAPGIAGRMVTLTGLSKDPNVCGVVSVTGDASTTTFGALGTMDYNTPWTGYTGGAVPVIPPLGDVFVCVSGVARVNIGALTVAAGGIMASATIPGSADDTPGTIGNILGIALEAQSAKDANNTIRCSIKIG